MVTRKNYPPGPFPLPIFGNIFQIDALNFEKQLLKWKKQYGKVITVWIPDPQIIVSDHDVMKEFIKNSEAYSGRPTFRLMELFVDGNYGLVFDDDSFWRNQKRFALHVLRDFGFGKPILEETIIDQSNQMKDFLIEQKNEPVDPNPMITTGVGNIVHQLTFGWTVPLKSDYIMNFRNNLLEAVEIFLHPMGMLYEFWPGFAKLDPLFGNVLKRCVAKNDVVIDGIKDEIKKHRETLDFDSEPRDYIDAFLIEQKRQNFEKNEHGEWSDRQLIGAVYDLFGAGMETTSTSIRTFILYMVRNPEIQKKIHEEIDREIGKDDVIGMAHQTKLPYLVACIQELQRIAVLLSLNLQHSLTETVELNGFTIPKGTTIIPQFPSIHLDDDHFPSAEIFDPTRHLDKNGKFIKNDKVTPFSVGKRSCLGESLAKMELFIFISNLLQKFEFLPEIDGKLPQIIYQNNFIKSPKPFKIRAIYRS
uniref:Cytochrome P450 n=1 Tax=Panagrolaimus sp. JU765 TaxID=591449 RepID=A0AC34QI40_9BILA